MTQNHQYSTKIWNRSPTSKATTIPKQLLLIRGVQFDDNMRAHWSITDDDVTVRFAPHRDAESNEITVKPWNRSKNSYAVTLPDDILRATGYDEEDHCHWYIDSDSGNIVVEFLNEVQGADA